MHECPPDPLSLPRVQNVNCPQLAVVARGRYVPRGSPVTYPTIPSGTCTATKNATSGPKWYKYSSSCALLSGMDRFARKSAGKMSRYADRHVATFTSVMAQASSGDAWRYKIVIKELPIRIMDCALQFVDAQQISYSFSSSS
ncbi:MAG TPA: hypothetical protein VKK79_07130 [Candidatus Lokiarchaeia archaeon]|nr:hypothetical protein [Candidatus Lokiarchaeia archaeon]